MPAVGIDFGASRIRAAIADDGDVVRVVPCPEDVARVPRAVEMGTNGADAPRVRLTSLKRLLDFESCFPASSQLNSIDLAAKHLGGVKALLPASQPAGCTMVAVPPCFSQRQRSALQESAMRAGFPHVSLVDDTLAALLANGTAVQGRERLLVYSWGAGSFSVAVYRSAAAGYWLLAQEGERAMGGDDLDTEIASLIVAAAEGNRTIDEWAEDGVLLRVAVEAERLKRFLNRGNAADVPLATLFGRNGPDEDPPGSLVVPMEPVETTLNRLTAKTFELTEEVVRVSGGVAPDAILLVGGTSLFPQVERALQSRFDALLIRADGNAVAVGAAAYGRRLSARAVEESHTPPRPAPPEARTEISRKQGGNLTALHGLVGRARPGRNEPCPCGSGVKYKKCHGRSR